MGILHGEGKMERHGMVSEDLLYGRATGLCGMHSVTQMTSPNTRL